MANKVMAFENTFQASAVALGNGTAMDVGGLAAVAVQITGINGDTITFEGTIDDSTWVAVRGFNMGSGTGATTATTNGIYLIPVSGLSQLRARVSTYSAGTIIIKGKGVVNSAGFVA